MIFGILKKSTNEFTYEPEVESQMWKTKLDVPGEKGQIKRLGLTYTYYYI